MRDLTQFIGWLLLSFVTITVLAEVVFYGFENTRIAVTFFAVNILLALLGYLLIKRGRKSRRG